MIIEKAHESLRAAELCFTQKLYNSTVNRAYYAMFQAAAVALEAAHIEPAREQWSHERLQATFALELTRKRKLYPHALTVWLVDGLRVRNEADYQEASISERQAQRVLRWAREFVTEVERVTHYER